MRFSEIKSAWYNLFVFYTVVIGFVKQLLIGYVKLIDHHIGVPSEYKRHDNKLIWIVVCV